MQQLVKDIKEQEAGGRPIIIAGDLNVADRDEDFKMSETRRVQGIKAEE